jgi:hypothetical protein
MVLMKKMDMDKDFHYYLDLLNEDMNEKKEMMDMEYFEVNHDMRKNLDDKEYMVMNDKMKELDDE